MSEMQLVECNKCHAKFDEDPAHRHPCPTCESVTRITYGTALFDGGGTFTAVGHTLSAPVLEATATQTATLEAVKIPGPAVRETISTHLVELRWDAPAAPDESTMLSAWVDGECVAMGMQQGDDFGLLMDLADDSPILPPWSDDDGSE